MLINIKDKFTSWNSPEVFQTYMITLVLLGFWGLKFIHYGATDFIYLFLVVLLAIHSFWARGNYHKMIRWYLLFVMVSCCSSWALNGQNPILVIGHSYDYFALLFFFYLVKSDLSSKETIKVMEMLALTFCIGYIVQWLIYPTVIFSQVDFFTNEAGKYRARMTGSICCYFLLMYSINKFLLKKDWIFAVYGVLAFIPIIIQGFRTLVGLSAVSAFLMIPFVLRSGRKTFFYSLLGAVVSVAILSTSLVQSKMEEMMGRQERNQTFDNDDYIRVLSFDYYWNQQFKRPVEKILGGGRPVDNSTSYTKRINIARNSYNYRWTDLGIVGLSMIIGIPAVLILVLIYLRCIWSCKEPEIQFVRFTFLIVLLGSGTTAEMYREGNILLLSFFLYLEYKYHKELKIRKLFKKKVVTNNGNK